jgi:hypothetical protein
LAASPLATVHIYVWPFSPSDLALSLSPSLAHIHIRACIVIAQEPCSQPTWVVCLCVVLGRLSSISIYFTAQRRKGQTDKEEGYAAVWKTVDVSDFAAWRRSKRPCTTLQHAWEKRNPQLANSIREKAPVYSSFYSRQFICCWPKKGLIAAETCRHSLGCNRCGNIGAASN